MPPFPSIPGIPGSAQKILGVVLRHFLEPPSDITGLRRIIEPTPSLSGKILRRGINTRSIQRSCFTLTKHNQHTTKAILICRISSSTNPSTNSTVSSTKPSQLVIAAAMAPNSSTAPITLRVKAPWSSSNQGMHQMYILGPKSTPVLTYFLIPEWTSTKIPRKTSSPPHSSSPDSSKKTSTLTYTVTASPSLPSQSGRKNTMRMGLRSARGTLESFLVLFSYPSE